MLNGSWAKKMVAETTCQACAAGWMERLARSVLCPWAALACLQGLQGTDGEWVELTNGCMCCAVKSDFLQVRRQGAQGLRLVVKDE